MFVTRKFIVASVTVVLGSFAMGLILTAPTPLDVVLAYQKPELREVIRPLPLETPHVSLGSEELSVASQEEVVLEVPDSVAIEILPDDAVPTVPFYSQFHDITPESWKKVGCGIASLAMLIEFYKPGSVVVDTLLEEGIAADAYLDTAGWTYAGLITIAKKYDLAGTTHDYGSASMDEAYEKLRNALQEGPVMASVHYTFQRSNPIPHLVIINSINEDEVFYNDPAADKGGESITVAQFKDAWKKRYITFRPL